MANKFHWYVVGCDGEHHHGHRKDVVSAINAVRLFLEPQFATVWSRGKLAEKVWHYQLIQKVGGFSLKEVAALSHTMKEHEEFLNAH